MSQKRRISDFFGPKKAKLHENTSRANIDCAGNNDSNPPPVVKLPAVATTSYSVGEEPCQPKEFHFPARRSASEIFSRSFKVGWFGQWTWLHYVRETDTALCFVCCSAIEKKLVRAGGIINAGNFIKGGFGNWRKAGEKFREHEKSHFHTEAMSKLAALKMTPTYVLRSKAVAKEHMTAQTVLELAIQSFF